MTAKRGGSRRSSHRNKRGHRTGPGRGRGGNKKKLNPTGMTVSQAKKIYRRALAEGHSLEYAMNANPAETIGFHYLIDDEKKEPAKETPTTSPTIGPIAPGGVKTSKPQKLEVRGGPAQKFDPAIHHRDGGLRITPRDYYNSPAFEGDNPGERKVREQPSITLVRDILSGREQMDQRKLAFDRAAQRREAEYNQELEAYNAAKAAQMGPREAPLTAKPREAIRSIRTGSRMGPVRSIRHDSGPRPVRSIRTGSGPRRRLTNTDFDILPIAAALTSRGLNV